MCCKLLAYNANTHTHTHTTKTKKNKQNKKNTQDVSGDIRYKDSKKAVTPPPGSLENDIRYRDAARIRRIENQKNILQNVINKRQNRQIYQGFTFFLKIFFQIFFVLCVCV